MSPRLALLVVISVGTPCSAFQLRKDSQGDVVRWPDKVEFVIDSRLADRLGEAKANEAIEAAIATMEGATPKCRVTVRIGKPTGVGYQMGAADNQNDILALEDWPYDGNALAATIVTLNARTNEIIDADIVFNDEGHHFRVVDALSTTDRSLMTSERIDDIQNTVTHELGHALGLLHNEVDPAVVMYPSAGPLEVSKRVLAQDDEDGLLALYSTAEAPAAESLLGCASTTGGPMVIALVAALAVFSPRRRRVVALLGVLAVPLHAVAEEPGVRFAPDLAAAREVSVVDVRSRTPVRLPENPRLIFTDVELTMRECVKGPCPATRVIRVPGGRIGDIEQVVAHQPVPALDERILLVMTSKAPRVVRLTATSERAMVVAAFERARLALPVSLGPQASPQPLTGAGQPTGFVH